MTDKKITAAIVMIDQDGNIRGCHGTGKPEGKGYDFPKGEVEDGESDIAGAIRELREETGYTSDEVHFLKKTYQDEGCSSAQTFCFIALNCYKVGEPNLDFDENIKLFECTFDEVKELVEMGYIAGAGNIVNILYSEKFIKDNNIQLTRKDDNESYN